MNPLDAWSNEEIEHLKMLWPKTTAKQLGVIFGRSEAGIRQKLKQLSLPLKKIKKPWTREQDDLIAKMYSNKMSVEDIAKELGHTVNATRLRANRIHNLFRSDTHLKEYFKSEDFYQALKGTLSRKTSGARCCLCNYEKHIDLHHIDGNNRNCKKENIASLCPNHHREVERGEHANKKLWCIWWRRYSDGSRSQEFTTLDLTLSSSTP